MKIVFMGTPQAAVPSLARLIDDGHEIVGVYTQPDRPAGRGNKIVASPVKQFALEHTLTLHQPVKIRSEEAIEIFRLQEADVAIVIAYGRILPPAFLEAYPHGAINVHFSLLPKYRGAAPVNWAIVNGETETGVTTMKVDTGLDTGPILLQQKVDISTKESSVELLDRLAQLAPDVLSRTLGRLETLRPQPQNDAEATFAPILKREDGLIDWTRSAAEITNRVRGFQPFPTAWTIFRGAHLTVWKVGPEPGSGACGTVLEANGDRFVVACGNETALRIAELQPEGKRRMSGRDFINGGAALGRRDAWFIAMKISPARNAAFDILFRIETERAYSSILLPQYESKLSEKDRGLCHELTLGTLRRQIYLDRVIDHYATGKKLDAAVRIALRIGLYQLYFLDKIPDHSAVDDSVNLVQRARKTSAKGFVNAILRRASTERVELPFGGDIDRLSIETSHPRWLLERWIGEFGFGDASAMAAANNTGGRHAFRIVDDIPSAGIGARPSEFVEGCYLVDRIDHHLLELAQRGDIYFQDEGSQMVAATVVVPDGGGFLDVCAAPGGKAGLVVQRHRSEVALAAAGDLYWPRVLGLRENLGRQHATGVSVLQYDAEIGLPFADATFDTVLVDAPCSGTGTIRHNPELRYFLEPADIGELAKKQLRILKNASNLVKCGGTLVYATCSLEAEENEAVCSQFANAETDFTAIKANVADRFRTADGFARTFPHRDEMDGFFVAEFRRK